MIDSSRQNKAASASDLYRYLEGISGISCVKVYKKPETELISQ